MLHVVPLMLFRTGQHVSEPEPHSGVRTVFLEDEPAPTTRKLYTPPAPNDCPNKLAVLERNQKEFLRILLLAMYLMVYEDELKRTSGSNSASQNLAFLSFENTSSHMKFSTALTPSFCTTNKLVPQLKLRIFSRWIEITWDGIGFLWQEWAYVDLPTNVTKGTLLENVDLEWKSREEDLMVDNGRTMTPTNESLLQACGLKLVRRLMMEQ
ncbi:hypothetical protein Tco_1200821 [Tanacetum coccineum]